jgi:hypothetical protein
MDLDENEVGINAKRSVVARCMPSPPRPIDDILAAKIA